MKKRERAPEPTPRSDERSRKPNWRRTVRGTVLLLLVAAVGFTLYYYRGEMTMENLRDFLAGVQIFSNQPVEEEPVRFSSSASNRLAFFKNVVVLADGENLTLFSESGHVKLTEKLPLASPMLFVSEKYVFAYSLGGTELKVADTLSVCRTLTSDLPICGGAFDDVGGLILINENASGQASCVTVYDRRFRQVLRQHFSDRFAAAADINERGECAVAVYGVSQGEYASEIIGLDGRGERLFNVSVPESLVLWMAYLPGGQLLAATDRCALVLDGKTGEELQQTAYGDYTLCGVRGSPDGVALTLKLGAIADRGRVICLGADGLLRADLEVAGHLTDALFIADKIYVLELGSCRCYETDGTRQPDLPTQADASALLAAGSETFYIICSNHAQKIRMASVGAAN